MHSDINCLQHVGIPFISETIGVSFLSSGALFCRARKMHVQSAALLLQRVGGDLFCNYLYIVSGQGLDPILSYDWQLVWCCSPGALLFFVLGWPPRAQSRGSAGHGAWSCRKRTGRTYLPWTPCPAAATLLALPNPCLCPRAVAVAGFSHLGVLPTGNSVLPRLGFPEGTGTSLGGR